jgi:ribosome maturation factor RimP
MGTPARTPDARALRSSLEPIVISLGMDLEDIEIEAAGRRRRVCVIVDRDGGVDLDGIAEASRAVSDALDASDAMGDAPYTLEVTSPGVDRPLTLPRHWRRNVGRRVQVDVSGASLDGRIMAADESGVDLAVDRDGTAEGEPVRASWAELGPGRVQIEFRRVATPEEDA